LFGNITRAHYDIGYVVLVNLLLMLPGLLLVRYVATRVEGE
jgi:capsular polysaccharide transport system permease protein